MLILWVMKIAVLPALAGNRKRVALLFDIVNGFFNRCRGDMVRFGGLRTVGLDRDRHLSGPIKAMLLWVLIIWLSINYRTKKAGAALLQCCRWWCGLSSVR